MPRQAQAHLRIGELGRRVGVSAELLRAWERRYGLLQPQRSPGGFRLYGADDEMRLRRMLDHLENGVSASQAARLVLEAERAGDRAGEHARSLDPASAVAQLGDALEAFDGVRGHTLLDELLSRYTLDTVVRDVVLAYLRELGDRWTGGEVSIAQEHFASGLLRDRLLGLARGWGGGAGPLALLAAAPGERHDLGLIAFGLALRSRGLRVTFLGPDTPIPELADTAGLIGADLVVVGATMRRRLTANRLELGALARRAPLAIAGAGADAAIADSVGCRLLEGDPVSAAEALAT